MHFKTSKHSCEIQINNKICRFQVAQSVAGTNLRTKVGWFDPWFSQFLGLTLSQTSPGF